MDAVQGRLQTRDNGEGQKRDAAKGSPILSPKRQPTKLGTTRK
jgi:hypothetical protein